MTTRWVGTVADMPTALEVEQHSACPQCGERRTFYAAHPEDDRWVCTETPSCVESRRQRLEEEQREIRRKHAGDLALKHGVPLRYQNCAIETWEGTFPQGLTAAWLVGESFPSVTMIWGPAGSGKTHLATALFREALIHSGDGLWISAFGYLELCRRQMDNNFYDAVGTFDTKPEELPRKALTAPVLVLDDLGFNTIRTDTRWPLDRLGYLICHRYDQMLATIVTSNSPPTEFNKVDPHLASRLFSEVQLQCKGRDRRLGA